MDAGEKLNAALGALNHKIQVLDLVFTELRARVEELEARIEKLKERADECDARDEADGWGEDL